MQYDLLIKNVRVVRPNEHSTPAADIGIKDEKFSSVGKDLDVKQAKDVYDGKGWLAFPGVVDAHMHTGIYAPLAEDAVSESRAAAQGGVTSSLNYFRTGQYYLNRGGPYRRFMPEVLRLSELQLDEKPARVVEVLAARLTSAHHPANQDEEPRG